MNSIDCCLIIKRWLPRERKMRERERKKNERTRERKKNETGKKRIIRYNPFVTKV